ncbi:alpha/beta fold hydrolase [Streptomyces sp. HSW2009]|uniref:alpha/beta fold hydrolase n=1 Tax=Streptomyces sp. HSW2009 TaxID=3142890 RepID=UPI0032ED937E
MAEIPAAGAAQFTTSTSSAPSTPSAPSATALSAGGPAAGGAAPGGAARGPLATRVIGSGPGLLLAHGAGGSIDGNYVQIFPALAAGHTVVAPDYPGSGATPRATGPLTLDGLADALVAEAVGADVETFTLVGYSLGSAVAVRAAVRHPERVRGLVLTAGLARANNRARTSLELWQALLAQDDLHTFARFASVSAFSQAAYEEFDEAQRRALVDDIAASVPAGTSEQAGLALAADTTADLPRLTVPTLVIATTEDLLVAPAHSRVLADAIPGAEYAELATGHLPMVERPAEWSALITDFLDRHGL